MSTCSFSIIIQATDHCECVGGMNLKFIEILPQYTMFIGKYCHMPARWGLQQTAWAATRHGARDPFFVIPC